MRNPDVVHKGTGVFILTCQISPPGRLLHAEEQVHRLFGTEHVIIVDGVIDTDPRVDALFDPRSARLWSKRAPTRGEIAAYGTHRLAWETLLMSSWSHALIFEDDFHIQDEDTIRMVFENAAQLLADGRNIVKLFDFPRERTRNICIRQIISGLPLVKWQRPRAGMVGYLISREGAQRFLARERIFRAVDEDIKYFWELGLDVWSIPQNAVVDASMALGGSLLEDNRAGAKRRNPMRSLHGLALNTHRDWRLRLEFRRRAADLRSGETLQL